MAPLNCIDLPAHSYHANKMSHLDGVRLLHIGSDKRAHCLDYCVESIVDLVAQHNLVDTLRHFHLPKHLLAQLVCLLALAHYPELIVPE